jgi:hypothetical protein
MAKVEDLKEPDYTVVFNDTWTATRITLGEIKALIKKHNIPPEYAAFSIWVTHPESINFERVLGFLKD